MKMFAGIVGMLVLACAAFGQIQPPKPPSIDVSGTAEILVSPDEVTFSIDVTKRNKDMNIAKAEADAVVAKLLEVTRQFDIKPSDVRTDYISVEIKNQFNRDPKNRVFDEDGDEIGTKIFLGYDVSTTVIVKLTDIKRFEQFFAAVMKAGPTEINSVTFASSKMIEERNRARQMAMRAAHDKASAMAGAINQTIGKAISVSEVSPNESRFSSGLANNTTANFSTSSVTSESVATFSPGSIKVTAQVNVTFLLN